MQKNAEAIGHGVMPSMNAIDGNPAAFDDQKTGGFAKRPLGRGAFFIPP
jgi:hypothetical protein